MATGRVHNGTSLLQTATPIHNTLPCDFLHHARSDLIERISHTSICHDKVDVGVVDIDFDAQNSKSMPSPFLLPLVGTVLKGWAAKCPDPKNHSSAEALQVQ